MPDDPASQPDSPPDVAHRPVSAASLVVRGSFGGVLMGLANLVPGISGGTMLLAAGIYPRFITAIGEVTTFKLRRDSLLVLGSVIVAAIVAIILLAGPVKDLVVNHRWAMYSLFIGLTLGGVPVVWKLIRGHTPGMWLGVAAGFLGMAALAYIQMRGGGGADREGFVFMLLAGAAGASAMILPGVSGGYLLLVLGVYVPILAGISAFKDALQLRDTDALVSVGAGVILPVGLGVLVGVVVISNLLKWLLARFERPTLGVLLGLLLGAVIGLYPFVQGVAPAVGDRVKGQTVALDEGQALILEPSQRPLEPDDYPLQTFRPAAGHVGGAIALVLGGFAATTLIGRFGAAKE